MCFHPVRQAHCLSMMTSKPDKWALAVIPHQVQRAQHLCTVMHAEGTCCRRHACHTNRLQQGVLFIDVAVACCMARHKIVLLLTQSDCGTSVRLSYAIGPQATSSAQQVVKGTPCGASLVHVAGAVSASIPPLRWTGPTRPSWGAAPSQRPLTLPESQRLALLKLQTAQRRARGRAASRSWRKIQQTLPREASADLPLLQAWTAIAPCLHRSPTPPPPPTPLLADAVVPCSRKLHTFGVM